jgi:HAD superfamily hydrolase (TIGR01509 family)
MPMKPTRIPYLLFDLGGTLLYFDGDWSQTIRRFSQRLEDRLNAWGYTFPAGQIAAELFDRNQDHHLEPDPEYRELATADLVTEVLAQHHIQLSPSRLRLALAAMYAVSEAHWWPEADAALTLRQLRSEGYRLGVVSNAGDTLDVHALVQKAGLRSYFDFILVSASLGLTKPHPAIYQRALAHWGALPHQAAMIGDTPLADIDGARGFGIHPIWITRRAPQGQQPSQPPAAVISTLAELPPLLRTWNPQP